MNNKVVLVAVGVIVVGALGWYFLAGNNGSGGKVVNKKMDSGANITEEGTSGMFSGSLADLMRKGGAYKCTFDQVIEAGTSRGTVYVSGQKIRGDFSTIAQGVTMESHMISDGEWTYTWSPMMPQGFKAPVTASDNTQGTNTQTSGSYTDMNQMMNYDCDPWSVESNSFTPPAGITFMQMPQ